VTFDYCALEVRSALTYLLTYVGTNSQSQKVQIRRACTIAYTVRYALFTGKYYFGQNYTLSRPVIRLACARSIVNCERTERGVACVTL